MNKRIKTFQFQLRTEKKILITHNSIVSSIPTKETFQKCQTNGGSKVPTNQRICIAKSDGYMYTVVACQAFWLVLLLMQTSGPPSQMAALPKATDICIL
ncbi:hypothetical protein ACFXTH_031805 [Malus domestica]